MEPIKFNLTPAEASEQAQHDLTALREAHDVTERLSARFAVDEDISNALMDIVRDEILETEAEIPLTEKVTDYPVEHAAVAKMHHEIAMRGMKSLDLARSREEELDAQATSNYVHNQDAYQTAAAIEYAQHAN
jgi:hypothetical protein